MSQSEPDSAASDPTPIGERIRFTGSDQPSPPPEPSPTDTLGRELTMLPGPSQPLGVISGRELTMLPPAAAGPPPADISGRELTMQTPAAGGPPATDLSGRELTLQTPSPGADMRTPVADLSGRELTLQTPTPTPPADLSGREMTLQTPATGIPGRHAMATPLADLSGREVTMQAAAATPTPATAAAGGKTLAGFKPRTGVGTSIAFDDAWHLQGRKGPHTGQTWGDFDLGGVLGEGGMGAVYRAKQKSLKRRVAIKVLPPNLAADPRLLTRFQLEASTTSKLQTPHVVQVYAIGEHDGNHFYAMEYVEGKDLYDIIKERREQGKPLTADEACGYILQAAKGLAEAGRHGIVHRDIKPPNMMVTKDGLLKIADFGIVKVLGEHQLTMTGQAVGTPAYVSPEQGRGDKEVDCRSDLYSLGVVFYELACDKKPFDGSTPNALIYQHCYEEPKLPKELNAAVTDEVQAVIMRCLQKKPENRYQSADELVRDLEAIRAGSMLKSAIANYKLGTGADEAKREQMTWLQRNMLPVAAAALLVLGGGGAGGWYMYDKRQKAAFAQQQKAQELALLGEKRILDLRKGLKDRLDAVAPLPPTVDDDLKTLASLAKEGEQDADVVRWRRKVAEVRALAGKLAVLDGAAITLAQRKAATADLETYVGRVGREAKAERWAARLKAIDDEEARLRSECAKLDTTALRKGDRDRFVPLLQSLAELTPKDDPQLAKWNLRIANFDKELTGLRARIEPLDTEKQVTLAKRQQYLPVLNDLKAYLDETDADLQRWSDKLGKAGDRVQRLREDITAAIGAQPERIAKPKQDQVAAKLADYAALAGADDPQLKDWNGSIAATERAIAGDRERLARFAKDSGDGLLPQGVQSEFERQLNELAGLVYGGDADVAGWTAQLKDSRRTLDALRADCRVLEPTATAPIGLAAQKDLAAKVARLAAKGGIEAERGDAYRARLAAEAKRVQDLRAQLAAFARAESITDAMRAGLARLAIDAGGDDADVARWSAKRDRVDALAAKLGALDRREGVPEDVAQLFAELVSLVGDKDPRLVAWKGKVARIGEATAGLRILDRIATYDAADIDARLSALAELIGTGDRQWLRWKAKAEEVARLKADLAKLPATIAQAPLENIAAHTRLRRLAAELVGPDDPQVAAAAARIDELDGPPRPAWATAAGRDDYGLWADADLPGGRLRLRYLASGSVLVGSPDREAGRDADELQVRLDLTKGFWLAETETPRAIWAAVTGGDPSRSDGDPAQEPAQRMTWAEAQAFCAALAGKSSGFAARLPLEAEWEYACRAGGERPWALPSGTAADAEGVAKLAWDAEDSGHRPHPVRGRLPNPLGLFDMHGNLAEWVADTYAPYPTAQTAITAPASGGDMRIVRGGSWGDSWLKTRAANRMPVRGDARSSFIGCRIAVDAAWGAQQLDGRRAMAAAMQGATAKPIEFDVGGWQVRLTKEKH